ncbi:MAG: caspase family protein [Chitinophagaceae bacterium]|jgi:hypothetical protein
MDKALLVGINKYADAPLRGCINDITDMAEHLIAHCNFKDGNIRLLADQRATKSNIIERLKWLITGARKGDRLFFQYSGHGTQLATRDNIGEVDGLDEAIVPYNFDWEDIETFITDNEFNNLFKQIPEGVQFVWVSDSCHSGGLTRQLFKRSFNPGASDIVSRFLIPPADINWRVRSANNAQITSRAFLKPVTQINVGLISGCKSNQTSADAYFDGKYNGALTYYLLQVLEQEKTHKKSIKTIVAEVNKKLVENNFSQQPQTEGNTSILNQAFLISGSQRKKPSKKPAKKPIGGKKTLPSKSKLAH